MSALAVRVAAAAREANAKLAQRVLDPQEDFYTQGLDSLDHVQILMKVEEVFGAAFADTDYDALNSLDAIAGALAAQGFG
jgi:acyl carrier protein